MLKPKKKITKRELKQDKFVTFTLQAKDWIEENGKMLVNVGIGLLVLIILVSFYVRSKRNANVEANAMLGEAQLSLTQGNIDNAEQVLTNLVENYDGVTAAGQGCFLLAKTYWQQEDYENAKTYFKKYIDDYAEDDLLTSGAYAGYADCLMNEGNKEEAAEYYEKAAKVNRDLPQTPSYLFSAASAYMEVENYGKARKLAQDILDNYSESQFKNKAEILLDMVKYKA